MSEHEISVCGDRIRFKRVSVDKSEFQLSFGVHTTDDELKELSRTFNSTSNSLPDEQDFQPSSRSDWTTEDIQRVVRETIERTTKVSADEVVAIIELEIEERKTWVWQPWKDCEVSLADAGIIPESEYNGPEPSDYYDE